MSKTTKPRLTVRVTPGQMQVLEELRQALGCNISLLIRTIIGDFLSRNEAVLDSIILQYEETGEQLMMNKDELDEKDYANDLLAEETDEEES